MKTTQKPDHPDYMYVAKRMRTGDMKLNTLVGDIDLPGSSWLPDGCCGIMLVFRDIESLQREYGKDAKFEIIKKIEGQ